MQSESVSKNSRFWYGWTVLAVVFITISVLVSIRNSIGFFFKPIAAEFGWNRAQTAGAYSIGMIVQSVCSPLFGSLGERWSLRWMMAFGIFSGGAALLIGAFINSLFPFYLMYALLNVGFAAATYVPQVQILSNWFVRRRGLAMGVSNSGQGFASVLNLAVPALIGAVGWRLSYLLIAGFTLAIPLPLAALLLRDQPQDKATVADAPFLCAAGQATAGFLKRADDKSGAPGKEKPSYLEKIFSLRFFLIACTYGSVAFVLVSIFVHLVPHATDQGFTPEKSAFIFLAMGLGLIAGNLFSSLSDAMGRAPTYAIGTVLGILACVLLAFFTETTPPFLFYVGAVLVGVAMGLVRPTASALLADHFAGPGFGRLNGLAMTCFALCGALGGYLTGYLFDSQNSYKIAFLLMAAVLLAGSAAAIPLGRMAKVRTGR